ncbi:MAG: hypothetical protein HQ591_10220 [candidate division Zixibacteria bacterium]|nr:hypothetical protein [Candidatus Tariuqbacter arcticus]
MMKVAGCGLRVGGCEVRAGGCGLGDAGLVVNETVDCRGAVSAPQVVI